MNPEWVAWAKEEIIALSKIVQEKNAEIERLKGGTPLEEIAMLRDKIKELEKQKMELLDNIAGWAKQAARDVTARHTPGRYKATDRKMVQLDELLGQLEWMKSK